MSVIYLVRHGQASFGTERYDRLSDTGRQQVRLLGEYFAELGEPIDRIYCGALQRQCETAQLLARMLEPRSPPVSIDPAFDEYDSDVILQTFAATLPPSELAQAGWPALHTDRRQFQLFLERAARAWVEARIAAAELIPWRDFHARITGALVTLMRKEGRSRTLIVSTSGGVIGTAVAHVLGVADHAGIELNWAAASGTRPACSSAPAR